MSWGNPMPPGWRDDFSSLQEPRPRPVDDLSRFVLDRIMFTESEPAAEVPQVYNKPIGPMVHRYAAGVRRDMVSFRRIVALYADAVAMRQAGANGGANLYYAGSCDAAEAMMRALAMRWSDHPDFRDEWRLE